MTNEQKQYIEDNINLIENNQWEIFFKKAGFRRILCFSTTVFPKICENIRFTFSVKFGIIGKMTYCALVMPMIWLHWHHPHVFEVYHHDRNEQDPQFFHHRPHRPR